jgi:hypothetical protein
MNKFVLFVLPCVVRAVPPPGSVLNLSPFDALQVPIDNGSGGFVQIKHPKLDTYTSSYMYTDPADSTGVILWAPENGVVSANGAGPRTELTEVNDRFTFSGRHVMDFTQQVLQVPSSGVLCIGQVKGDSYDSAFFESDSSPGLNTSLGAGRLIIVELIYVAKTGAVEAHMRDVDANNVKYSLGTFTLKEKIVMKFVVDGYGVYVSSNKVALPKYDYSYWKGSNYGMHFKVGVYDQNTGTSSTIGGKSRLSGLKITHS